MKRKKTRPSSDDLHYETTSAFGYELIRSVLIPELLGKEQSSILYWSGKSLARKYPLESFDDIIEFFQRAGWGHLSIRNEGKHKITFHLASELISRRLQLNKDVSFALETGFLAQQTQTLKNRLADAQEWTKKGQVITIVVEWDKKDIINSTTPYLSRSQKSQA